MHIPQIKIVVLVLILGWFAMGFGIFADELEPIPINAVSSGILAEDTDQDTDETKTHSPWAMKLPARWGTRAERAVVIDVLLQILRAPSIPRYQMLCVYRL